MSKGERPTHDVFVVAESKDRGKKDFWIKVGGAWAHESGEGFNVLIAPGISVSGKVVILAAKDDDDRGRLSPPTSV